MTVYFISKKGRTDSPVKIGMTNDLQKRLSGLQTGQHDELEVIASIEGGREAEAYLHESLAASRIRGEWFERSPDVEAAIRRAHDTGAPALPLDEPKSIPRSRRRSAESDVTDARTLCRKAGSSLKPGSVAREQIAAVHRKLHIVSPDISIARVKNLFYGGAERVDAYEMAALIDLCSRIERIDELRDNLKFTPMVAASVKEELGELSPAELDFFHRQMAKWRADLQRDEQLLQLTGGDAR